MPKKNKPMNVQTAFIIQHGTPIDIKGRLYFEYRKPIYKFVDGKHTVARYATQRVRAREI